MKKTLKILVPISTLLMYIFNILASLSMFNDTSVQEVSDNYVTLFTPVGITFSIWSIIYLLLALFTYYYLRYVDVNEKLYQKLGVAYIINGVANSLWLIAWSYEALLLSWLIMIIILCTLIYMALLLNSVSLSKKEKYALKIPITVYLGWISVATIANTAIYLVSIHWNGFQLSSEVWMLITLIIVFLLTCLAVLKGSGIAFGLVVVWALIGIIIQHLDEGLHKGAYSLIIYTIAVILSMIIILCLYKYFRDKHPAKLQ